MFHKKDMLLFNLKSDQAGADPSRLRVTGISTYEQL